MTQEYYKVGQNLRLFFLVIDTATGLADTSFTATSFTLQIGKELAGNQATTGCSFGVLDSVNNPGIAYIDVVGTTAFVSATGNYSIKVFRVSDAAQIWTETVRVTSDGTGEGTWGADSFIPVAGNGRVTTSGVALADATVRITTPAGAIYTQLITASTGLWSRVYFNADGTYGVTAQKSGYTIASGTIVVSSGVVTGPGTDLDITVASAANTLVASDQMAYARRMLTDNVGAKSDTLVLEIVNDALAYLAMAKQWPYLLTLGQINLVAEYSTGTVTLTNASTAAVLSGGTWPTWAASGSIYAGGGWVDVSTRTDSANLVLANAWGDATITGGSYIIAQHAYTLPTNLQRIDKIIFSRNWPYDQECAAAHLEYLRTVWQAGNSNPSLWAIRGSNFLVWPWPTTTYAVHVLYYKRPALLVSGSDILEWDPQHLMLLRRAIDYQCAMRGECVAGTLAETRATLDEAIDTAFAWDKTGADRSLTEGSAIGYGVDLLRGDIASSV